MNQEQSKSRVRKVAKCAFTYTKLLEGVKRRAIIMTQITKKANSKIIITIST